MTRILVNMTSETDLGYYASPISTAPSILHFTNGTLAKSLHNFQRGGVDATVTGAPTLNTDSILLTDNTNYLTTSMSDTASMTFLVIAKTVSLGTTGVMIFGNHGSTGTGFGHSLYIRSSGTTLAATRYNTSTSANSSSSTSLTGNVPSTWSLYVCEIRSDGTYFRNLTQNLTSSNTFNGTRTLLAGKVRIGANYTSTYDGQSQVLALVGYNSSLSEADIQIWVSRLRKYATSKGISV